MKYTLDQINQINNSMPIVQYASQYLELSKGTGSRSDEYWCKCPFHDGDINPSMSFNSTKNAYKCMGCDSKGYLINFVMQYHKLSFLDAINHILNLTDISIEEKEYSNIMEYLQRNNIKKYNKKIERMYLPNNIMDQYTKEPIIEWLKEGINQEILDKYDVRYNKNNNAIVFPIRDKEGRIIAVKARTLYENYKDLGISKYKYYNSIGTNDFLFGLYQNINNIKNKNEVIVLEGAKGVMLAESYRYNNVVSLETNNINPEQLNLLISLKVNVVFALDKGVKITNKIVGLLPKFTNVYIMEDKENLLNNKDCPADKGKEIFDRLYEGRYLYR